MNTIGRARLQIYALVSSHLQWIEDGKDITLGEALGSRLTEPSRSLGVCWRSVLIVLSGTREAFL